MFERLGMPALVIELHVIVARGTTMRTASSTETGVHGTLSSWTLSAFQATSFPDSNLPRHLGAGIMIATLVAESVRLVLLTVHCGEAGASTFLSLESLGNLRPARTGKSNLVTLVATHDLFLAEVANDHVDVVFSHWASWWKGGSSFRSLGRLILRGSRNKRRHRSISNDTLPERREFGMIDAKGFLNYRTRLSLLHSWHLESVRKRLSKSAEIERTLFSVRERSSGGSVEETGSNFFDLGSIHAKAIQKLRTCRCKDIFSDLSRRGFPLKLALVSASGHIEIGLFVILIFKVCENIRVVWVVGIVMVERVIPKGSCHAGSKADSITNHFFWLKFGVVMSVYLLFGALNQFVLVSIVHIDDGFLMGLGSRDMFISIKLPCEFLPTWSSLLAVKD
jgi:hypothetical protein